jgi:response regulator of citrate/malate metabolism
MIRVLVVDDDYHVAHAHALSVATIDGYAVVGEANSGTAALELIASTKPDLLLLDMYLPDFSGLDLVRRITASGDQIPDFLLLTAARDIDSVRTAMQLGAFYYLVKPFTFAALREQLQAYSAWLQRLAHAPEADQEHVDALYSLRGAQPRGVTARTLEPTMAKVLQIVTAAAAPLSAADVAQALGASRPTAQRCLAELAKNQLIELDLAYGTTGRPQHLYRPRAPRSTPSLSPPRSRRP